MKFATKAIRIGQDPDPATGATIPPIYQTSTFTQQDIMVHKGYEYTRSGNPTRSALEQCLAALEEGVSAFSFASGLAAESAVLSLLRPGDHIIAGSDIYGGTYRLLESVYKPLGVAATYIDASEPENIKSAINPNTKMVWIESPTNPLLVLADIKACAEHAHDAGLLLVVDNTFASPYLQKPLRLGADIVVHSVTKYINGHSDVLGGAVVTNNSALGDKIYFYQNSAGAVSSPFDAWLTLRGVKTLAVRMKQHCNNALAIAEYLEQSPKVDKVYYPGLKSHPQHELAKTQMNGFGGMVSFDIRGDREAARQFLVSLKIFNLAESLGGVESLASYPAEMSHGSMPEAERLARGIKPSLIRLSIGIEDADDLIEDLAQALG